MLRFDLWCSQASENFLPPTSEDRKAYRIDAQGASKETEAPLPWGIMTRNYAGIVEYVV